MRKGLRKLGIGVGYIKHPPEASGVHYTYHTSIGWKRTFIDFNFGRRKKIVMHFDTTTAHCPLFYFRIVSNGKRIISFPKFKPLTEAEHLAWLRS